MADIRFSGGSETAVGRVLAVGVLAGRVLPDATGALDAACAGALRRLIAAGRFSGEHGQTAVAAAPTGLEADSIVLLGLGADGERDSHGWEKIGAALAAALAGSGEDGVRLVLDPPEDSALAGPTALTHLALGFLLRGYRDDRFRSRRVGDDQGSPACLTLVSGCAEESARLWQADLCHVAAGVLLARDLFAEPGNTLYPESFVERLAPLAELGVDIEALGPDRLAALKMNALLAVAQGSAREARLAVLRWNGAADPQVPPIAFVGKGITFDSGGISLKPGKGMEEMKGDMAGAAAVVGAMRALAGRRAPVNAVGVLALAENMPGENALRPGDILTTMAGWTIEIINTDAEGRLVLADALWFTHKTFAPHAIIDLATLTYDIMAALGLVFTGLFASDDALAGELMTASSLSGEKLWRMPLDEAFEDNLGSDIADLRHFAEDEESADASHAAQLLSRFAGGRPWAHLDIAGKEMAYDDKPLCPKGPTGVGVRLLDQLTRCRPARPD
ncbi:MAG: leucyl aminopeptidase [Proteobacteria bacterium]|nr:leucyl aminopeptidase [Pseudomonadota bacterium]